MNKQKKHFAGTVAFMCLFGTAVAETANNDKLPVEPPTSFSIAHGAHKDAKKYVDAEAAGYDGGEEIQTKHFQLLALKKPLAPVRRIGSAKQWDAFIKEFAGIEIGTGQQLRYKPDFSQEQVLALFAGPELRGDDCMGIEVYAEKATLKGFVFHGNALEGKDPIAISEAAGHPFRGTLYLATVPKQFAHTAIEFRMGYQSWGRACSRFSPPIKNAPLRAHAAPTVADGAKPGPRETFVKYFQAMETRETDVANALKAPQCTDNLHMNIHNLDIVERLQPFYELSTSNQALVVAHHFTILSTVLDREEVIYAELRKKNGAWRIQRLDRTSPENASWLMKGFKVHTDVSLDLSTDALVGQWWYPCDSTVILKADGTGSDFEVGPFAPPPGQKPEPFTWTINGSTLIRRFADREEQLVVTFIDHERVRFASPNKPQWGGWRRRVPATLRPPSSFR